MSPQSSASLPATSATGAPAAPAQDTGLRPIIALEVDPDAPRDPTLLAACYRAFEFTLALTALVMTLPIMLVEAAIIRFDTPGPVLFFHTRAGRSKIMRGSELVGRTDIAPVSGSFDPDKFYHVPSTFKFIKFRTMYVDAKERFPELYSYRFDSREEFIKAFYKTEDDPRITPAGRWLRKLTIDEFPNLWTVLTGETALVGPRPEIYDYLPYYSAEEMRKFTVQSGITGLAVINGRGNISIGDQLHWDLTYVRTRSVMLDLKILAKTFWMILTRRGAI